MQLVIELPPREKQIAFNRKRWEEVCADPALADLPHKIETNAHGNVLMMPPASGTHSERQSRILILLHSQLGGYPLPECPVSTVGGVRAADVGWYSDERFPKVKGQIAFEIAPEICVEVVSDRNTTSEMEEKKQLYFEAGGEEVWLCDLTGKMRFFLKSSPGEEASRSVRCPDFPEAIA